MRRLTSLLVFCFVVLVSIANMRASEPDAQSDSPLPPPVPMAAVSGLLLASVVPSGAASAVETGDPQASVERVINEFASFPTAITSIGSAATTLVINSSTNVAGNVTVPASLSVRFTGAGQLSINSGIVVTFADGSKIQAPPTQRIFSGSGTVKFTGVYPDQFYPGWWGAVFDDNGTTGTDDLAAFNAMQSSMQRRQLFVNNSSMPYMGGTVKLPAGKFSYMSDTWHIRRPLTVIGSVSGVLGQQTSGWRWPAGKTGIVIDGISTFDGSGQMLETGDFATLEGVSLIGGRGTDSNNTVISINGLTATLTGGSITSVSRNGNAAGTIPAIAPGSTLKVNGYHYVVATSLSATATSTIPLEAPRIFVSANGSTTISEGGGSVITFPSNSDWVGSTVTCFPDQGAVLSGPFRINSMTTTTLTLNSPLATGIYTCKVSGSAHLTSQAARLNIYHGIDERITSKFSDVTISGFAGNGFQCHSEQLPSAYPGGEPNCNNSWLERVYSNFNAGSGFLFWGINANNIQTNSINAENNKGFGLWEQSLGSNHFSFHIAFNGQGAFKAGFGAGASELNSSYTEGSQPAALLGQSAKATGNFGAGFDFNDGYAGQFKMDGQGALSSPGGFAFRRGRGTYQSISSPKGVMAALGTRNDPNTMFRFGAAEEAYNLSSGGSVDVVDKPVYMLGYDQLAPGWYSLYYGGNYSTDQNASVLAFSGSQAAEGAGKLWLRNGIHYLGPNKAITISEGVSNFSKGANVASAPAIVPTGNLFHVTGTTTITSITSTGILAGARITIIFDGVLKFTDGRNLKLAGDFVTTPDDSITLVYDGANWYETSRSIN